VKFIGIHRDLVALRTALGTSPQKDQSKTAVQKERHQRLMHHKNALTPDHHLHALVSNQSKTPSNYKNGPINQNSSSMDA
jgi:hypothetical protein